MNPNLRTARGCLTITLTLVAGACYAATINPWLIVTGLYPALVFAYCTAHAYREYRLQLARRQHAEQAARGEGPSPLVPCCSFWQHSDGAVHGPDCTRPAAARGRLAGTDEQAFAEIIRRYDHGTAA